MPTSGTFRTLFFFRLLGSQDKNLYIPLGPIDHHIAEKSYVFFSHYFPDRSKNMSSQDSDGESYVADYIANPKVYGDVEQYSWTLEEEEDYDPKREEEMSSDEDEAPLPQPGDMHVEFKKSSIPNKAKKPKIQFIPFHLLQENKQDLCKKVLELEKETGDLKEENSILKHKLRKKDKPSTSSPPPPSSSPKEN